MRRQTTNANLGPGFSKTIVRRSFSQQNRKGRPTFISLCCLSQSRTTYEPPSLEHRIDSLIVYLECTDRDFHW